MQDEAPGRGRQGTVTVLALLLSLLLGYAPAAAATAPTDGSAARLGKSEAAKAGVALRAGGRLQSDDQESDDLLAGAAPRSVSTLLYLRPAASPAAPALRGFRPAGTHFYRARAPPAA